MLCIPVHSQSTGQSKNLEDREQQLISSLLLPPKLVLAEAAQQLQVRAAVRELVLVVVHLGILVSFDDCTVGEGVRHIPVLTQPCTPQARVRPLAEEVSRQPFLYSRLVGQSHAEYAICASHLHRQSSCAAFCVVLQLCPAGFACHKVLSIGSGCSMLRCKSPQHVVICMTRTNCRYAERDAEC